MGEVKHKWTVHSPEVDVCARCALQRKRLTRSLASFLLGGVWEVKTLVPPCDGRTRTERGLA